MTHPTIVIGAGIGGLSAAIRLAVAGRRVVVLEKNHSVGGKMAEVRRHGFRWDTGPSILTMRHVFEEIFFAAGRRLDEYVTLNPVEPLTRYFYTDGTVLDATRDLPSMLAQIEAIDTHDVEGYLDFLRYAAKLHRLTGPTFIYARPPSLRTLASVPPWQFFQVDPWLTLDQAIRRRVRSPHLRQMLGRFATYVGASPYEAPATLAVIAHVELNGGVWYPRGGIYAVAEAMQRLALEQGVTIETDCGVQQIAVRDGVVSGVVTWDGRFLPAQAVIANVDVTTVYQSLLPPEIATPVRRRRLARTETSCSGYALLLGVEGEHPRLTHHNILFSGDYRREFEEIFNERRPPSDPTLYIAITSKSDAGHAPPGCENWFVLVNVPATGPTFDWRREEPAYRKRVLETLARHGLDIRGKIRAEVALTPTHMGRMSGAWRGALYGISPNNALNAFRRPHNRCRDVRGLYFAGGTTHPGGGVPMVILSGKVAAEMAVEDNIDR